MFELILTLCSGYASSALTGSPGQCQSTYRAVVLNGERGAKFRTLGECQREYTRQIELNERTYVYVGLFFDRRVKVNNVRNGQCRRIEA